MRNGEEGYQSTLGAPSSERWQDKYRMVLPRENGKLTPTSNLQRMFSIRSATLLDQGVYTFSCGNTSLNDLSQSGNIWHTIPIFKKKLFKFYTNDLGVKYHLLTVICITANNSNLMYLIFFIAQLNVNQQQTT